MVKGSKTVAVLSAEYLEAATSKVRVYAFAQPARVVHSAWGNFE